jgi:hypothetical protein
MSNGNIYSYGGAANSWKKVGNPGRIFSSNGEALVGITPAGNEVWRYTGRGETWDIIGDEMYSIFGGGGKLYATDSASNLHQYKGGTGPSGWKWDRISGPAGDTVFMTTYAVAANDQGATKLFRLYDSSIYEYQSPDLWRGLRPSSMPVVDEIDAGGNYLWARDHTGGIWEFKWNEPAQECDGGPSGTDCEFVWDKIGKFENTFVTMAVDVAGKGGGRPGLYALSGDGKKLWKYSGTPNNWAEISIPRGTSFSSIYAGGGKLLGIKASNSMLMEYKASN